VLALLARSAGLNLAFTGEAAEAEGEGTDAQATISLDLEDEAVQDVFNYVLQLSGFQANRVGRTIFVGARLPQAARDIITRSFRMNQVSAASAAAFLSAQGAETQRVVEEVTIQTVGEGAAARTVETRETTIQPLAAEEGDGPLLLRGLSVVTDERLNAVTLIGEPRQIQIAASFLTQLDLRRRQVAVNVKVLDIDLSATDDFNTSFSFGIDDDVLFNFSPGPGGGLGVTVAPDDILNNDFFAQLLTQIQSGNGKILTDPTLVVQEGETAQVDLTREVVGNIERTRTPVEDGPDEITVTAEIVDVGLILNINVERIDDNGFITLVVNPEVTSIAEDAELLLGDGDRNTITLRSIRRLTSGRIRLRDGQTLILTGIIQDQEQTSIFKVPILGDLPIIGALFRDTERNRVRSEVIVVLTPQILDDSENAGYGYNYTPDPETRRRLERRGFETRED
jgi:type IV pilus assembly protein PilQ